MFLLPYQRHVLRRCTNFRKSETVASLGREPWKSLWLGLRFFCICKNSGKNEATGLVVSQLWGSIIAKSLVMCQASTSGQVLALARVQVLQNSGSLMVVLRFTTLSALDCHWHWRNPRKKNRAQEYKSACVSALAGSVLRKMAKGQQWVSAPWGNQTQVAWLAATHLTTKL